MYVVLLLLPPFSFSKATVASRCSEFGVFEWSSRSVCRGAGLAVLDAAGSKVRVGFVVLELNEVAARTLDFKWFLCGY